MAVDRVVVVGAGMVGLSCAWFLQERGVEVTVVDRAGVAADASWGNAGWIAPALTMPLPEPSVLRYGLSALLRPSSPVYVPPTTDPRLVRFLVSFARHCTPGRFRRAAALYVDANARALDAYDEMTDVAAPTRESDPFVAVFASPADRAGLVHEFDEVRRAGGRVELDLLNGDETRALEPMLTDRVGAGLRLRGQRYLDPPRFTSALADAVRARGGTVAVGDEVRAVDTSGTGVRVVTPGRVWSADAVVLATGARLGRLARPFGVRRIVQAGRGYSFSVRPATMPRGPIYLPVQRVACTPLGDRLRVAGMMEFRSPDAPLDPRRIRSIVDAAAPYLGGVDWAARTDEWVGSRPCTADGLPLVGRTHDPRVFVAGGHGMWGIALGPLTGRWIAQSITEPGADPVPREFSPVR